METAVYEIVLKDGRTFRVFCANSTQVRKVIQIYHRIVGQVKEFTLLTNGLHTAAEFERIINAG